MKLYLLLLLCFPLSELYANTDTSGIKFEQNLSWEQIKAKAKQENKYIFVDCYATWCGPCKAMDKDVFQAEDIALKMNRSFINVKLQMDRTRRDGDHVKMLYPFADTAARQYFVNTYPTYLFFTPDGILVQKEVGYKYKEWFLKAAIKALSLTSPYHDPLFEFHSMIDDYRRGVRSYDKIPFMIDAARKSSNLKVADTLMTDYYKYLSGLPRKQLYDKKKIEFIADHLSSRSSLFPLFLQDGRIVDSIMQTDGYAIRAVDGVIRRELHKEVLSKSANIERDTLSTMSVKDRELNWDSIYLLINKKYNSSYADRNILWARHQWYEYLGLASGDKKMFAKNRHYFFNLIERYGIDAVDRNPEMADLKINAFAWEIVFKDTASSRQDIKKSIILMEKILPRIKQRGNPSFNMWDTYANLLYKDGRKSAAIQAEKEAVKASKDNYETARLINEFEETLYKMEKNMLPAYNN